MCLKREYDGTSEAEGRIFASVTVIGSDDGLPPGRRQAIIWIHEPMLKYC